MKKTTWTIIISFKLFLLQFQELLPRNKFKICIHEQHLKAFCLNYLITIILGRLILYEVFLVVHNPWFFIIHTAVSIKLYLGSTTPIKYKRSNTLYIVQLDYFKTQMHIKRK